MSQRFLSFHAHLREVGLLGEKAVHFGGPDDVLLYSGGPQSHLAQYSMLCGPSRKRVLVRQPSQRNISPAQRHSPLKGEVRLVKEKSPFVAQVEEWKHGCWYHLTSIFANSLPELLEKLHPHTPKQFFETPPDLSLPQRPFWSGALAYDMVQWTRPLQLQHVPEEGELLVILWLVERMAVHEKSSDLIRCHGLKDDIWCQKVPQYLGHDSILQTLTEPTPSPETSSMTDDQHEQVIESIRESIRKGQMYQVNVGRWWNGKILEHPRRIFQRLNEANPAPFSGYLEAPDLGFSLVCSSPESLLKSNGESIFTSPIKGTRPRGSHPEQEDELRNEMIRDEKERSEHRMLVDLMRNDISAVSKVGSVQVERFDVEAYAQVQHLVSHISGVLEEGSTGLDALQAVFPGGSITGCPRTVVCAAIDELEERPRSFWTGSIGWVDITSGACSWNILIRTLIARKQRGQWYGSVAAGGGITIGSDPKTEVEEAKWKAAALRKACGWVDGELELLPIGELAIHQLEVEAAPIASGEGTVRYIDEETQAQGCVLLIDNLDSFTLNIAHAIAGLGRDVLIYKARDGTSDLNWDEEACVEFVRRFQPTHIVLGPGPGEPTDSPLTMSLAHSALSGKVSIPILGICLGHQALGMAAGMKLVQSPNGPVHGAPRTCLHNQTGIFSTLQSPATFTRYNSLSIASIEDGPYLETAHEADTKMVMGIQHPNAHIHGIQFHPESVGSKEGLELLKNFLALEADA
ncbi:MAG: chorismate-binding protein [Candidatus Poseidoniales archaeon]|jgi:anthranilate synthase|tara:strand:+ start:829 stop:3066 length:2238 start_codon:yes stop_codon:yes gene_type:complete